MKTSITKGLAAALICSAALTTAQAQGVKVNGKEIPASRIEAIVKVRLRRAGRIRRTCVTTSRKS